jgi:carboxyl-terminal processing protease
MRKLDLLAGCLAAPLSLALVACVTPAPSRADSSETFQQLKLFGDVFERVRAEYVEEVTDEELIESAINGMLTSLDPHSGYLDAERHRDMQVQTKGEFGGLGIEVTMEDGLVKVVSPIDDTPAARAGIMAGDFITHIDGSPVMGMTLSEAVEQMRGPVNSKIELVLRRLGREDQLDVTLERAVIKISPVRARVEHGDIGYVRVTTFNEQTDEALEQAVKDLRAEIGDEMRGLVLDLRNNPGGLLDEAVSVSDLFLDKGEIVSTRGRRGDSVQRFNARLGDLLDGMPMVVLINGGSASASEIVAGALHDHHRAILMGTQSFGKGSVQTIMPLPGHGAIRLTTARYYTPAGTSIQATGIEPDIEVPTARVEVLDEGLGRREADLRNRLDGDGQSTQPEAQDDGEASAEAGQPGDDPATDYQLSRAIDLLQGISVFGQQAMR